MPAASPRAGGRAGAERFYAALPEESRQGRAAGMRQLAAILDEGR